MFFGLLRDAARAPDGEPHGKSPIESQRCGCRQAGGSGGLGTKQEVVVVVWVESTRGGCKQPRAEGKNWSCGFSFARGSPLPETCTFVAPEIYN